MKTLFISFVNVSFSDPRRWLEQISFYTGIVDEMSSFGSVCSIHCIDKEEQLDHGNASYLFFRRKGIERIYPGRILSAVKRIDPDVVIIHSLVFPFFALLLRKILRPSGKIFVQHHAERPLTFPRRQLQQRADLSIDGYFFCSAKLAELWVAEGQISSIGKVHEVMEVSSHFRPIDRGLAKEKLKVFCKTMFLWVGRLDENKDPLTLLRAFIPVAKENPSCALYLIFADNELLQLVKPFANERPNQVILVGKVEHDAMETWFNAADFIISTSHYEGSGVAVCEAMSCGCYPILTRIPSFEMMTSNGSVGKLFQPGNVGELTSLLDEVLQPDASMERLVVLDHFSTVLSFKAIARKIYDVACG